MFKNFLPDSLRPGTRDLDLALPEFSRPPTKMSTELIDLPTSSTIVPGGEALMMNEFQLRQIQQERQMLQTQEVATVRNDMQVVKMEVSDLKSMLLQIGLASGSSSQPPPQVVVNTQNNITQEMTQKDTADGWFEFNKTLRLFFSSPLNRFCFFGTIGFGLYVYNQRLGHSWRMNEMQRRIDANLFLRMAHWFNPQRPF
eukprot:GEMP01024563.1.p1 GENE.GEMP01024563.1~~GEMP01024563.1.p1  ORF type:complete len:234 (+),score=17.87 GEMP01024563.1:107-703(+)